MFLLIQAIVLGLLQGLTEFLPVSSSGHLQAVPYLFGWGSGGLTFDVLVHAGTLVAVIWFFRTDLAALFTRSFGLGDHTTRERRQARKMVVLLAIASVPAALAGLLFGDIFEAAFSSPRAVAGFLYLTGVLLWVAERVRRKRLAHAQVPVERAQSTSAGSDEGTLKGDELGRGEGSLRVRDAVTIGTAQALAIFPGISRSGATIATGMVLGLSRTAAARFAFLLAIPIVAGATVYTLISPPEPSPDTLPFGPVEIAAGVLAATLSGYWAVKTMLALVARRDLLGFAKYVTAFATVLFAATFILE